MARLWPGSVLIAEFLHATARPVAAALGARAADAAAAAAAGERRLRRGARAQAAHVRAVAGGRRRAADRAQRVWHAVGTFVYVRESPSTDAPLVTIARHGVLLTVDAERDGWLRTTPKQGSDERVDWRPQYR